MIDTKELFDKLVVAAKESDVKTISELLRNCQGEKLFDAYMASKDNMPLHDATTKEVTAALLIGMSADQVGRILAETNILAWTEGGILPFLFQLFPSEKERMNIFFRPDKESVTLFEYQCSGHLRDENWERDTNNTRFKNNFLQNFPRTEEFLKILKTPGRENGTIMLDVTTTVMGRSTSTYDLQQVMYSRLKLILSGFSAQDIEELLLLQNSSDVNSIERFVSNARHERFIEVLEMLPKERRFDVVGTTILNILLRSEKNIKPENYSQECFNGLLILLGYSGPEIIIFEPRDLSKFNQPQIPINSIYPLKVLATLFPKSLFEKAYHEKSLACAPHPYPLLSYVTFQAYYPYTKANVGATADVRAAKEQKVKMEDTVLVAKKYTQCEIVLSYKELRKHHFVYNVFHELIEKDEAFKNMAEESRLKLAKELTELFITDFCDIRSRHYSSMVYPYPLEKQDVRNKRIEACKKAVKDAFIKCNRNIEGERLDKYVESLLKLNFDIIEDEKNFRHVDCISSTLKYDSIPALIFSLKDRTHSVSLSSTLSSVSSASSAENSTPIITTTVAMEAAPNASRATASNTLSSPSKEGVHPLIEGLSVGDFKRASSRSALKS